MKYLAKQLAAFPDGAILRPEKIHFAWHRAISVYSRRLVKSVPEDCKYPESLTMTQIASMIGEALPPKFAEAQAQHITAYLACYKKTGRCMP